MYRDREDEAAVSRLRAYFFTDGLWDELSERAQRALVTADRALVSATHSRHALIVNELRIAVEETLHDSLWKPLSEWAATQRPPDTGLRAVLDKPEQQHRAPGLDDYIQLLWHRGPKAYLEQLGMPDDNVQLLTNPKRATRDLRELQRVRNRAEHEPRAAIGAAEARSLYAKFLGIGRKGVLPELVRVLNERRA